MAKGSEIVVSAERNGREVEGILLSTYKPGTLLEIDPAVEPIGGRHTWRVYTPGSDGGLQVIGVLDMDKAGGRLATTAYSASDHARIYFPCPGEELNVLIADVGGTADDYEIGDQFVGISGSGKLKVAGGSEEMIPFVLLETLSALTADTLAWMMYTGH